MKQSAKVSLARSCPTRPQRAPERRHLAGDPVHARGREIVDHDAGRRERGGRQEQGKDVAFLEALRRDFACGRAAGIGKRRRMLRQRFRQHPRIDQALGEEQQREAGVDRRGFRRDRTGKGAGVGLIRGERREAACIARARTGQLPSPAFSSDVFLCASGARRRRHCCLQGEALAMGRPPPA